MNDTPNTDPTIDALATQLDQPKPKPQGNILLDKLKVLPPEVHRLPSGGLLYKNEELKPEVLNGELEFSTYTAIDELDLSSPDLLMDGRAIERVVKRCVPGVAKPLELFAKDLDYVMLVLHKVSYGDAFRTTYIHSCKDAKEHSYEVSLGNIIRQAKVIDPTSLNTKYSLKVGVGETSYSVNLRPLRAKHAIDLLQNFNNEQGDEDRKNNLFALFMFSISDVDGITDAVSIIQWLQKIPISWINLISKRIEEISNWGVPYTAPVQCKDCQQQIDISVNVNPLTFFT